MVSKAQLDKAIATVSELSQQAEPEVLGTFEERLLMSWIYHDNALDGNVYTPQELQVAVHEQIVSDTSLIPVYDDIRQYKAAIDFIKIMAGKKRLTLNLELLHKLHTVLDPPEPDSKPSDKPAYRHDMPLHRLYFHDIAPPEKIPKLMDKMFDWLAAPETKRNIHAVRLAARVQFQLMHIYPYSTWCGQTARLFSNLILLRHGFPPSIIHATDRQHYYEALKTSDAALAKLMSESMLASLQSTARYFQESATPGIESA